MADAATAIARRLLAALGLALALAGCATAPATPAAKPTPPADLFVDAAFSEPTERPDPAAVFALSPAMRQYLERDIASHLRLLGFQRGLVDALYSKAQLRLDYDAEVTRNAAEAFDARSGNCLSLVVMTAALARHLELPITFQALAGYETWSRSGDLSFVNGHVNIAIGKRLIDRTTAFDSDLRMQMSFGDVPLGRGQALVSVSEATILAMFMNNRAAEHLVRGRIDEAYAYAREAVVQDPTHAGAYNTLGVVYQRRGLAQAAERAYREALAREADLKSGLQNLARLLEAHQRGAEAAPLRARLAVLEREPPFAHFDLGVAAARAGDFAAARDHILREMKRDGDYHEFHFWLAVAYWGLGDAQRARRHLKTAMDNSLTVRDQAIYAAKLRGIEPAAPGTQRTRQQ